MSLVPSIRFIVLCSYIIKIISAQSAAAPCACGVPQHGLNGVATPFNNRCDQQYPNISFKLPVNIQKIVRLPFNNLNQGLLNNQGINAPFDNFLFNNIIKPLNVNPSNINSPFAFIDLPNYNFKLPDNNLPLNNLNLPLVNMNLPLNNLNMPTNNAKPLRNPTLPVNPINLLQNNLLGRVLPPNTNIPVTNNAPINVPLNIISNNVKPNVINLQKGLPNSPPNYIPLNIPYNSLSPSNNILIPIAKAIPLSQPNGSILKTTQPRKIPQLPNDFKFIGRVPIISNRPNHNVLINPVKFTPGLNVNPALNPGLVNLAANALNPIRSDLNINRNSNLNSVNPNLGAGLLANTQINNSVLRNGNTGCNCNPNAVLNPVVSNFKPGVINNMPINNNFVSNSNTNTVLNPNIGSVINNPPVYNLPTKSCNCKPNINLPSTINIDGKAVNGLPIVTSNTLEFPADNLPVMDGLPVVAITETVYRINNNVPTK